VQHVRPIFWALAALAITSLGVVPAHAGSSTLNTISPESFPRPFEAAFEVKASNVKVAQTRWRLAVQANHRFVYESRTESEGIVSLFRKDSIVERSAGIVVDDAALPLDYHYDRNRGGKRRSVQVRFDWESGTAANSLEGQTWKMAIPDGTLDKLSYLLMMMRDLRRGKRALRYEVADGGKLKTYRLEMVATEEVTTPLGTFSALGMRRVRDGGQRETVFWCAERLGYLPVKVSHREPNGNALELVLTQIKGL